MEIQWEDPPATARINSKKPGRYADFAAALKANPGRWARVPVLNSRSDTRTESSANALSQNIRSGKVGGFAKGEFDTAVDGTDVWARAKPMEQRELPEIIGDLTPESDDDEEGGPTEVLTSEVRAWAKEQGRELADRGRLPKALVEEYLESIGKIRVVK